ncbi:MAG: alginate export family protein [Nitrospinota bacterium]|nr:alginate export family protein [Nitrospinota bacterium]
MKHNPFIAIVSLALLFSAVPSVMPGATDSAVAEVEVTVSGELRVRPEMRDNSDFNADNDDKKGFWGSRTRINVNAKVDDNTSAKIVLQDARYWGELANNVQSGREKEAVDIYEGYFQTNSIGGTPVGVKLGRQALVYGDQRMLGHLGWQDNARTHDALKLMVDLGKVKIDLFTSKEKEDAMAVSDELNDSDLNGAYATIGLAEGLNLDVYVLQWKTSGANAEGARTKGHNVMSMGALAKAKFGAIDASAEFVVQSGDWNATQTQAATAMSVTAGLNTDALGGSRIGVEFNTGSGDDNPSDGEHKTFVFPYHTNHAHYGHMDYFSWGNMQDIAVKLQTKAVPGFLIKLDYHMLALMEANDDWLNVVGTGVFKKAVDGSTATEAGTEIDLTVVKALMPNWKLVGGYSMFMPGKAAEDRSGGKADTSTWGYLMSIFTF